jgi:hypothetical protein
LAGQVPGRGLREAADVGIALVAGVAGAQGAVAAAVDDAGRVVAALVDAARVQRTHLQMDYFIYL